MLQKAHSQASSVVCCYLLTLICACVVSNVLAVAGYTVATEYRTLDGTNNNVRRPSLGAANTVQLRRGQADYSSGYGLSRASSRPSARALSNSILANRPRKVDHRGINSLFTAVGELIAHDISSTVLGTQSANIAVPTGDFTFDPASQGASTLSFKRSLQNPAGTVTNRVSSFIDLSPVYGSTPQISDPLREYRNGLLKVSRDALYGDLLPPDTGASMDNPTSYTPRSFFLSGDSRANENPVLLSLLTVFVREHNRWANTLAAQNSGWSDEVLYQEARRRNIAQWQRVVFSEYLPLLFAKDPLPPYTGYDPSINPAAELLFTTVTARYGICEENAVFLRFFEDNVPTNRGHVLARNAMYNPRLILEEGIEPFLRGAVAQRKQEVSGFVIEDLRNNLFTGNGNIGMDLIASYIQRGRDHGLPSLNAARSLYGLATYDTFADIISDDSNLATTLSNLYQSVDDVDVLLGSILESPFSGGVYGTLLQKSAIDQFQRLRDGDRFWYEQPGAFSPSELQEIYESNLGEILSRNSEYQAPYNVFYAPTISSISSDYLSLASFPFGRSEQSIELTEGYILSWNYSADTSVIDFELRARTQGWVGIGFGGKEGAMEGADMVIGYINSDGAAVVGDYYALGLSQPLPDLQLGGTSDIYGISGGYIGGESFIRFKRKTNTMDRKDAAIKDETLRVIYALSVDTSASARISLFHHGRNRGTKSINFLRKDTSHVQSINANGTVGSISMDRSFNLSWYLDDSGVVTFNISAYTLGWIGLGISGSAHDDMVGADILWITTDVGGSPVLVDGFSTENAKPVSDSSRIGGQQSVRLLSYNVDVKLGLTSASISRSMRATDAYDRDLIIGKNRILYAFGSSKLFAIHDSSQRGSQVISLGLPPDNVTSVQAVTDAELGTTEDTDAHVRLQNGMDILWAVVGNQIEFEIRAKTTGWIALGFNTAPQMPGADIIYGYVDESGATTLVDAYTSDTVTPQPDTFLEGGKSNAILISSERTDQQVILRFRRPLAASDPYDVPIVLGATSIIIYAYGDSIAFKQHRDDAMGSAMIIFNSTGGSIIAGGACRGAFMISVRIAVHSLLVLVAWAGFGYAGVIIASRLTQFAWRIPVHAWLMTITWALNLAGAIYQLTHTHFSQSNAHKRLGFAMIFISSVQVVLGLISYFFPQAGWCKYIRWFHRKCGWLVWYTAQAACLLGLILADVSSFFIIVFCLWVFLPPVLYKAQHAFFYIVELFLSGESKKNV